MRKKILIISSILVLLILSFFILWKRDAFFSEYSYFTAKRDIKNGDIKLYSYGLPMVTSKDKEIDAIRAKYGFKSVNLGCIVSDETDTYNEVMEEYLTKRNGKDWRINFRKEIDSIYKIAFNNNN